MKRTILSVLFLLNSYISPCQTYQVDLLDTSYFDFMENESIPRFTSKPSDGNYIVNFRSPDINYIYLIATVEKGIYNGPCQTFHENGRIKSTGYFLNGYKIGKWSYFDDTGRLYCEELCKKKFRDKDNNIIFYLYDILDNLSSIISIKGQFSKVPKRDTLFINPIDQKHLKLILSSNSTLSNDWEISTDNLHIDEGYGGNSIYLSFMSDKTGSPKGNCGVGVMFISQKYEEAYKKINTEGIFLESQSYIIHIDYCTEQFPFWADKENKDKYQAMLLVFLKEIGGFIDTNYKNL